jgi:hypothetical protein
MENFFKNVTIFRKHMLNLTYTYCMKEKFMSDGTE